MRVITTRQEMAQACRQTARPLGLVPTMGALHAGHLELVRRAREDNSTVAVTIFINPTQFGPKEDLGKYPRALEQDLALLRPLSVDLVYAPSVEQVYPSGFDTWVDPGKVAVRLEGACRPGHFRGVATVVTKLFTLIRPDRAYFGQKDGQQCLVVRQLARDLDLGVDVVVLPTVREHDGLAMSSRNAYLTPDQRWAAPVVYRALCRAEQLWREGERDAETLRQVARAELESEPLVEAIDYVSVADADTLEELDAIQGKAMASVAVSLGRTRLIDNVILG
ncbi:MAG: pantoate--beta-alanine ligase [SAR202 cluster bacterium]|nr:pantoate--beta-alanine ligase [SAR202 cluster bacterium]